MDNINFIGKLVDKELNPLYSSDARGDDLDNTDDEDGVTFKTDFVVGLNAEIELEVPISLTAGVWIDFDQDGTFANPGERVLNGTIATGGIQWSILISVPSTAKTGKTFMRVRCYERKIGTFNPTPTGNATTGEVEDYEIEIKPESVDYGDALASYGSASHKADLSYYMGSISDGENAPLHSSDATGDDTDHMDDEEGVIFKTDLVVGQNALAQITLSTTFAGPSQKHVAAWIDFDRDGVFQHPGECVTLPVTAVSGPNIGLPISVPAGAVLGKTFARFRLYEYSPTLTPLPTGRVNGGEVEDYQVEIKDDGIKIPTGGVIIGTKYNDVDGDGVWNSGEPVLSGWNIWLDANQNGVEDAGDQYQVTDSFGQFMFTGLTAGSYLVGEKMQPGWIQTFPAAPGTHTVSVTTGVTVQGILFGNRQEDSGEADNSKWSQTPLIHEFVELDTSVFRGWREQSVSFMPMAADDWYCYDPRPVTAIRWWGGYADWDTLPPPPDAPRGFHVGVWSDVPRGEDEEWSHPGVLIHEWETDREALGEIPVRAVFHPEIKDPHITGYEYVFNIPQDAWFYQEGDSTIYWLSITALYDVEPDVNHWGWLTREHYFHDDAVRMMFTEWPQIGSLFERGEPIGPRRDLAFELSTEGAFTTQLDFGDAPDHYGTLLEHNGAHHRLVPDVYLGVDVDAEGNGLPHPEALGDDQDGTGDEDGVAFTESLFAGQENEVTVTVSTFGFLSAWVDFNGDGGWHEEHDFILPNIGLDAGEHTLPFHVPGESAPGQTVARFRFSREPDVWFNGFAMDGEVEDYLVTIQSGTAVDAVEKDVPSEFKLYPNYPNPFNPSTSISFALPRKARVILEIYNVQGARVKTLVEDSREVGNHTVIWDGTDTSGNRVVSGLYLCRMKTSRFQQTIRMLFLK